MNRYGLSRHIPKAVAQQVRQECGFGCVVCGASLTQYEHIDPEFHDAREHDPKCIALLCESCHGKVTRKFWSKEKILAARISPRCKSEGFSWGEFDVGTTHPWIKFGGNELRNCKVPVELNGYPAIAVDGPEEPGGPFRISATFGDEGGKPSLVIENNTWNLLSGTWDAEFVGGRIKVRSQDGPYSLVLHALPPHGVVVESLRTRVGSNVLVATENELEINGMIMTGNIADNCIVGLSFD